MFSNKINSVINRILDNCYSVRTMLKITYGLKLTRKLTLIYLKIYLKKKLHLIDNLKVKLKAPRVQTQTDTRTHARAHTHTHTHTRT